MNRQLRLRQLRRLLTTVTNEIADLEAQEHAEQTRLATIRATVKAAQHAATLCGTDSGYYHHRNTTKTPTCGPCRAAHAAAERARVQRRQAAA